MHGLGIFFKIVEKKSCNTKIIISSSLGVVRHRALNGNMYVVNFYNAQTLFSDPHTSQVTS